MSSKNNPENRSQQEQKKINGKVVKPCFYVGKHMGHGNYMAAVFENGDFVFDAAGKRPIAFSNV